MIVHYSWHDCRAATTFININVIQILGKSRIAHCNKANAPAVVTRLLNFCLAGIGLSQQLSAGNRHYFKNVCVCGAKQKKRNRMEIENGQKLVLGQLCFTLIVIIEFGVDEAVTLRTE